MKALCTSFVFSKTCWCMQWWWPGTIPVMHQNCDVAAVLLCNFYHVILLWQFCHRIICHMNCHSVSVQSCDKNITGLCQVCHGDRQTRLCFCHVICHHMICHSVSAQWDENVTCFCHRILAHCDSFGLQARLGTFQTIVLPFKAEKHWVPVAVCCTLPKRGRISTFWFAHHLQDQQSFFCLRWIKHVMCFSWKWHEQWQQTKKVCQICKNWAVQTWHLQGLHHIVTWGTVVAKLRKTRHEANICAIHKCVVFDICADQWTMLIGCHWTVSMFDLVALHLRLFVFLQMVQFEEHSCPSPWIKNNSKASGWGCALCHYEAVSLGHAKSNPQRLGSSLDGEAEGVNERRLIGRLRIRLDKCSVMQRIKLVIWGPRQYHVILKRAVMLNPSKRIKKTPESIQLSPLSIQE